MNDFKIFEEILNDPTDINPSKYYPSSIIVNENIPEIISTQQFYSEYIRRLQMYHAYEIEKYKQYLNNSFTLCELFKQKYENILRNQHQNK